MYSSHLDKQWPPAMDITDPLVVSLLVSANKFLAELKGKAKSLPNEAILLSTIPLQEAKDSSEIENIITTYADLYKAQTDQVAEKPHPISAYSDLNAQVDPPSMKPATKEARNYIDAILKGWRILAKEGVLRLDILCKIQEDLIGNSAGIRKQQGTTLKNAAGHTVYTPPQDYEEIMQLLTNLLIFINDDQQPGFRPVDPLVKMALIHHRFETIHPFYDGNGRVGRILNILYLIMTGLLDSPIIYLSRYITHNKKTYYQLLQEVRQQPDEEHWRAWIIYMLRAVQATAQQGIKTIEQINDLFTEQKQRLKSETTIYSQELLNALLSYPYTTRRSLMEVLGKTYPTIFAYLEKLTKIGMLERERSGKTDYFINTSLTEILVNIPSLKDKHYED